MDPVRHLIGTANGCGGNPSRDALYVNFVPADADANTPHVLRLKDVPVDGFWSITVYNAKGFFEEPAATTSVNSVTATRDAEGSVTVRLGGD